MLKSKNRLQILFLKCFQTKVELEEKIDTEIIGGFILRIDDNYIDASIRNKLRKIKKELTRKRHCFRITEIINKEF